MGNPSAGWTFLTNHGHVLVCLTQSPGMRLRSVAAAVGVTERAVQRIVAELEEAGYLRRKRIGRRNEYEIDTSLPLRHPIESHRSVQGLIDMVGRGPQAPRTGAAGMKGSGDERQPRSVKTTPRPRRAASASRRR
jgi:MarR family